MKNEKMEIFFIFCCFSSISPYFPAALGSSTPRSFAPRCAPPKRYSSSLQVPALTAANFTASLYEPPTPVVCVIYDKYEQ